MSWYVLQCKTGQEQEIVRSCKYHLSSVALEAAFSFRCERLWKMNGLWNVVEKEMFPGYVFLQSSEPGLLSKELEQYRTILRVMEDHRYLISVYEEEEQYLQKLCGNEHILKLSYGYKDREKGVSHIVNGPLKGWGDHIVKIDWHKRYAQLEMTLARYKAIVWAGVDVLIPNLETGTFDSINQLVS